MGGKILLPIRGYWEDFKLMNIRGMGEWAYLRGQHWLTEIPG